MPLTESRAQPSANDITARILLAVSERYHPHAVVFRLNVIVARASRGTVRSAPNGISDILGTIHGRAVAIEVKAGRDRIRPDQSAFGEAWEKAGGIYITARDVDHALAELDSRLKTNSPLTGPRP